MTSRSTILQFTTRVLPVTVVAMFLSMLGAGPASAALPDCVSGGGRIEVSSGNSVSLHDCIVTGNHVSGILGGAVNNAGDLHLTNVVISNNSTDLGGGGIYNGPTGTLTLINVVITGNQAGQFGGGIYNDSGTVVMSNVTVGGTNATTDGNTAALGGGGIALLGGTAAGAGLAVVNNKTTGGNGGGILNTGAFCVGAGTDYATCASNPSGGDSLVTGNHANAGGGGGIANTGSVILTDSTVDSNHADGGDGGGILTQGGGLSLANLTISNNTASGNGGGMFNDSALILCCGVAFHATNLTIAGNQVNGNGGGVYTTGGLTLLAYATIADNLAVDGGGVYDATGGTEVLSTLVARNSTNCFGTIVSEGSNLDTDGTCAFSDPSDLNVSDAGLRPTLAANGGPTTTQGSSPFTASNGDIIAGQSIDMMTLGLTPTSPAVDAVAGASAAAGASACPAKDERGIDRPVLGKVGGTKACDIGAYELAPCLTLDKTCAVVPPTSSFTCKSPIKALQMEWAPGSSKVVDIKAWTGKVGEGPVTTLCEIDPGDIATVTGLGSKPDSFWQIYEHVSSCGNGSPSTVTGKLIGQSKFHVGACDDPDMNSADDCSKFEGDGKDNKAGFINQWKLAGMTSSSATNGTLVCTQTPGQTKQNCVVPVGGGEVVYSYTVTNIGPTAVKNGVLKDQVDNVDVVPPISFTLAIGETQTYTSTATIVTNTTNVATATGTNDAGECVASDKVTVNVACVLGYPFTSSNSRTSIVFSEPGVLRTFQPDFAGPDAPDNTIRLFYNDEHAHTLGVRQVVVKTTTGTTTTSSTGFTTLTSNPASATNPNVGPTNLTGDVSGADPVGAPTFPALFITDLTINGLDSKAGDWQFFGTAIPPHFVSGTWKGAVRTVDKTKTPNVITVTPDADPAKNNWKLGSGSDPVPPGLANEGYGAEVRWNVSDLHVNSSGTGSTDQNDPTVLDFPGHTFRIQFMVHDGDQNKTGGDVGQGCNIVTIPE